MRKGYEVFDVVQVLLLIAMIIAYLFFAVRNAVGEEEFQDELSDRSQRISVFYKVLSSTCLNNDYEIRGENRKYIADIQRLDIERENIGLSCLDLGNTKYRLDIKDLVSGRRWTFSNFQPVEAIPMMPDLDIIMQVNTNSRQPEAEGAYIQLDDYHPAILSAYIEPYSYSDLLQDEMYCGSTSKASSFVNIYGSDSNHISHIYKYGENLCISGNCIKGPGQLKATCQISVCSYSGLSGEDCLSDCECRSAKCENKKCTSDIPTRLALGQPCVGAYEEYCESGICASNLRCGNVFDSVSRMMTGSVYDSDTRDPLAGVSISIINSDITTQTDNSGDFFLSNVDMSTIIGTDVTVKIGRIRAVKDGYIEYITPEIAFVLGQSRHIEIPMEKEES